MNRNCAAIAGAMFLTAGWSLTLASPALADVAASSATMPGPFTDEVLQKAVTAVNAAESSAGIKVPITFSPLSGHTTNVYNYENWFVCGQTPAAGDPLPAGTTSVTLTVRRADEKCPTS